MSAEVYAAVQAWLDAPSGDQETSNRLADAVTHSVRSALLQLLGEERLMRISEDLVLQYVEGAGVVLLEQSTGTEIVIPFAALPNARDALDYFAATEVVSSASLAPNRPIPVQPHQQPPTEA